MDSSRSRKSVFRLGHIRIFRVMRIEANSSARCKPKFIASKCGKMRAGAGREARPVEPLRLLKDHEHVAQAGFFRWRRFIHRLPLGLFWRWLAGGSFRRSRHFCRFRLRVTSGRVWQSCLRRFLPQKNAKNTWIRAYIVYFL